MVCRIPVMQMTMLISLRQAKLSFAHINFLVLIDCGLCLLMILFVPPRIDSENNTRDESNENGGDESRNDTAESNDDNAESDQNDDADQSSDSGGIL